ncbi:MAG: Fe-S protein assembly co-chaperone HscB [Betaproteobacteria bacterium]|nr:Fe-S protein assembly co-chaperone HscB [Betaproteobacteria bacterium]
MDVDLRRDFFSLFGLPRVFAIDTEALELAYRDLQSLVHPDRYAHLPETERRLSMQWATHVNEGYRTLRKPLARGRYLLSLNGVEVDSESNTAMSPDFLMEQMEWREAVEEARTAEDAAELERLHHRLRQLAGEMVETLRGQIDAHHDYHGAAESVRRLMFIEKLQHDIDDALLGLES